MMPLSIAEINKKYTILKISGHPEIKKRLEDLGIHPGANISIVSKINQNLIINIKETRIAIDRTLSNHIFVN